MRFFFYGTLMDEDVLGRVLGRAPAPEAIVPATLDGYRRTGIRGRHYPMIVASAAGQVRGILVHGLDTEDGVRLTWYESDQYDIVSVHPRHDGGRQHQAWTFMPRPGSMIPAGDWSLADWQRRHKAESMVRLAAAGAGAEGSRLAQARRAWSARTRS